MSRVVKIRDIEAIDLPAEVIVENGDRLNIDQVILDAEESAAQLRTIGRAAELVEDLRGKVAAQRQELKALCDQLQTAEWNVVALARAIAQSNRRAR